MHPTELPVHGQPRWQRSLARAVRSIDDLCQRLKLPRAVADYLRSPSPTFPLLVPESFLARMQPGNPRDPLLLQVLPKPEEDLSVPGFVIDPVGDMDARRSPGLLEKYSSRVLLITAGACAVHCRYCFRRHYPYGEEPRSLDDLESTFREIEANHRIKEVILSGGDPLTRTDVWLERLARRIADIPHVHTLRIHTRLPVVLPERVNDELLAWMSGTRLKVVMVLHSNHARELMGDAAEAIDRLRVARIVLLNQAVLLRGVNDSADALEDLSRRLFELGVLPYYLHQLDRVAGASHFEVSLEEGKALYEKLRQSVPGYLLPRYVFERKGASSKLPIA